MRLAFKLIAAALVLVVAWYAGSYQRGMLMANIDLAMGHRQMMTYGFPAAVLNESYPRLLQERYGVTLHSVGNCSPSWDVQMYADGYNSVAVPFLNELHKKDIF